jgi:S1-C subfamily serine protease
MHRFLLPTLAALALMPSGPALAQQSSSPANRLALCVKPAVVRIRDGAVGKYLWKKTGKTYQVAHVASGSGFFADPNGYVVTNAHVVDVTQKGPAYAQELLFRQFVAALARDHGDDPQKVLQNERAVQLIRQGSELTAFEMVSQVLCANGEILPFEIKACGVPDTSRGKDVAVVKVEVRNAPVLILGNSDSVQLLDRVVVAGYPGAADTFQHGALRGDSMLTASLTDGSVSARKPSAMGAPILQLSAPATHGNSGGPVIDARGEVIGILTFRGDTVNGQEVTGFIFAVTSNTVKEFFRQAGGFNSEGLTDQLYRQGLDQFWSGDYAGALRTFDEVRRLFPQHSETDGLIRSCQEGLTRQQQPEIAVRGGTLAGFIKAGEPAPVVIVRSAPAPKPRPAARRPMVATRQARR